MAVVSCKVEIPAIEGLQADTLTVGREFLLSCEGEFPRDMHPEKMQVVLKPEEKYNIHLLNFEFRNPTTADLKVTAYRAGEFQFKDLQVTDGTQTLSLGPVAYKVATVIQPPEMKPGEQQPPKQEPFGPMGPAQLPVPMIYWAILAAAIGLVALLILTKIFRVIQRKNMLEKLREHDSALTPLGQFHQNLRRLQRKNPVYFGVPAQNSDLQEAFDELNKGFLLFLTRQYRVPALEWNERLVLKDLKKYHHKIYNEFGADLKKLYKEFGHGSKDKQKLSETDILNLTRHTRMLLEKMEASK